MSSRIKTWSLLSRHGQALIILSKNPKIRILDLAKQMCISERSARLLIHALHRSKIIHVQKQGRNNTYEIDPAVQLPSVVEKSIPVKTILELADYFPNLELHAVGAPS